MVERPRFIVFLSQDRQNLQRDHVFHDVGTEFTKLRQFRAR